MQTRNIVKEDPMKKFVAVLIFLTLFCAGAFAFDLTIRAYDLSTPSPYTEITVANGYAGQLATVYKDGIPQGFAPYTFNGYTSGEYKCLADCWEDWLPTSVYFGPITASMEIHFYAYPTGQCVPVELSSFTAMLTSQYFVNLTWVSQSETVMLGYRVYRSETNAQADAIMITDSMVPATNTSTTQTYSVQDTEVEIGHTYYYWLESVDMGSSQFHGPVSVLVEGEVPPILPEITSMKGAYPNPFKANTNIEVSLKAGESGSVTIYNVLGQVVRTFNVEQGTHTIQWDGMNSKGDTCGSGIYFYKLATPSVNQTKKMVIVK